MVVTLMSIEEIRVIEIMFYIYGQKTTFLAVLRVIYSNCKAIF